MTAPQDPSSGEQGRPPQRPGPPGPPGQPYGPPPGYGTPPAPGIPPAYGTPSYGTPPAPGTPPSYGTPSHGAPQEHGAPPPGYGAAPGYGSGPGYSAAPGYGAAPYGAAPYAPQETDSKAVVALVLAIASFVVIPFVPAVVAVVLAGQADRSIAQSGGRRTGTGLVQAARITAWINIALCVAFAVLVAIAFASLE